VARRKSFGEKLARELRWLPIALVFLLAIGWFCFFVLPDIITEIFRDALGLPTKP
jgi:hypothetical protein